MSMIAGEIKECMTGLTETAEGNVTASFIFPSQFIGFQGHFPDRPILPGICKIQSAMVLLGMWKKTNVILKEIVLAKFFSPVSSGEKLIFQCQEDMKNADESLVKALVTCKGEKTAQLQLRVSFEDKQRLRSYEGQA